ncbi:DUF2683 family protein [Olivibacter sp. XZL3]|uniref:DUF2683 family protein n=1 Tax=Olivibacter sp. XZL3 TaxID=1735116 RepID=UPI001064CF43|nr:DUF2683 family protein [Olivibacter sp. XZL3]
MDTILIRPKNKTQLEAIKAFAKALKMDFETNSESPYDPDFVKKILDGREDVKNGKGVKIAVEDLWK